MRSLARLAVVAGHVLRDAASPAPLQAVERPHLARSLRHGAVSAHALSSPGEGVRWDLDRTDASGAAVLVANSAQPPELRSLWTSAQVRICADGGANRLAAALTEAELRAFPPHIVVGDMDSADPQVLAELQRLGAEVDARPGDQDSTDLEKALSRPELQGLPVLVTGELGDGGRLDHGWGTVNALLRAPQTVVALAPLSWVVVLKPGRHTLHVGESAVGAACGVVPLGGPAVLETAGLKWNLSGDTLAWGAAISVCNRVEAPVVRVETSAPVLWTLHRDPLDRELGAPA